MTPIAFYTKTKDNFLVKETIFSIFGLAVALLLILKILLKKQRHSPLKNTWLGIPLILYLTAIVISSVNATHLQLVVEYLFCWIILTAIYFTAITFSETESAQTLTVIFISTFIVAVYGILQYLNLDPVKWLSDFGGRPSSSFGNPNFFAGYLLLVFPLIFAKMISTREATKHIFWMVFCFLTVFNIGVTKTRGAWFAFFIAIICLIDWQVIYMKKNYIITQGKWRMFRGTFWIFLLFSALFIISIDRFVTIKSFFKKENASVSERIFKWKTGWGMIKSHPFFGVGAGNLKVNFANYQAKVKRTSQLKSTSESNLHNEFLQRFAETGIFGIATFLVVFFSFFYFCARLLYNKIETDKPEGNLVLGLFTGLFAVFVYGLTNFPFSIIPVISTMFVLFGIAESYQRKKQISLPAPIRINPIIFLVVLVGFCFIISQIILPRFVSDKYRLEGDIAVSENDFQTAISKYEKAIKLDYYHSERTAYDLGEAYRKLNQIDKAIDAYKISVALRNYGEVYNNIGNCYYIKNDFDNALKNWKRTTEIGLPDDQTQQQIIKSIQILENKRKLNKSTEYN